RNNLYLESRCRRFLRLQDCIRNCTVLLGYLVKLNLLNNLLTCLNSPRLILFSHDFIIQFFQIVVFYISYFEFFDDIEVRKRGASYYEDKKVENRWISCRSDRYSWGDWC